MARAARSTALRWWLSVILGGLALGIGSAALGLYVGQDSGTVSAGPWKTHLLAGSSRADMYTRARVTIAALFALDKKETIYYRATTDTDGASLSGDCTYRVEGAELGARWWSVTAYGADHYLIANDANVYSLSKSTVEREADGRYVMRVSARQQKVNWLPVKPGSSFDLTVRLYNPEPSVYEAPAAVELPRIVKESCP